VVESSSTASDLSVITSMGRRQQNQLQLRGKLFETSHPVATPAFNASLRYCCRTVTYLLACCVNSTSDSSFQFIHWFQLIRALFIELGCSSYIELGCSFIELNCSSYIFVQCLGKVTFAKNMIHSRRSINNVRPTWLGARKAEPELSALCKSIIFKN